MYTVDEALEELKVNKITSHKESVRRWLRNGTIRAETPSSKKEGWKIREDDLQQFIRSRTPEPQAVMVRETSSYIDPEKVRADMWWELVRKHIFEGNIEIKKSRVKECVEHNKHSKEFFDYAWEEINRNKRGYKKPTVFYLLEACLFDSNRIVLDSSYETLEERIIFSILEYLRLKKVNK